MTHRPPAPGILIRRHPAALTAADAMGKEADATRPSSGGSRAAHAARRGGVRIALLIQTGMAVHAFAHSPDGITQRTRLVFDPPALLVEYTTTFGPLASPAQFMAADTNWDQRLSTEEAEAYLRTAAAVILPKLSIWLEDRRIPLTHDHGSRVAMTPRELTRSLRLRGDLGQIADGTYAVRVTDANPPPSAIEHIAYACEARRGVSTQRIVSQEGQLEWFLLVRADLPGDATSTAPASAVAPQSTPPPAFAQGEAAPTPAAPAPATADPPGSAKTQEGDRMANFIRRTDLPPGVAALALLLSAGLGALHALSPGHGKALVAAYLVGSRGTVRHAITLGAIVTVTHVGSVLLVGLLVLGLSARLLPEQVFPWLGFGSGILVSGVGLWMLTRRALGVSDEDHHRNHTHDHHDRAHHNLDKPQNHSHHDHESRDHGHNSPGCHALLCGVAGARRREGVTWGSLLSLGVAGGMVPCPSALVVLLTAIAFRRIAFGLALILAFSVGLAIVLIVIGILCVKAAHLVNRTQSGRTQRLIRVLPVLSAVLVTLTGAAIAINALLAGGILRFR